MVFIHFFFDGDWMDVQKSLPPSLPHVHAIYTLCMRKKKKKSYKWITVYDFF